MKDFDSTMCNRKLIIVLRKSVLCTDYNPGTSWDIINLEIYNLYFKWNCLVVNMECNPWKQIDSLIL